MNLQTQLSTRRINKDIPVPYYYQIAQILREVIEDARPDPEQGETSLPSEADLCDIYAVTRGTIRHALEVIEREGLIYREKGRGTFLTRRRVELDLTKLCSTTEDMRARGWNPSTQVLGLQEITPRPHIQHTLDISQNELVWELHRLRLANGEPISLQWSYIPCSLSPNLGRHDLTGSLYYVLRNSYGIELRTADQVIRMRSATLEEARVLEVSEGDALFAIERVTCDQRGAPVEHLDSLWRGDRYDLRVRLLSSD